MEFTLEGDEEPRDIDEKDIDKKASPETRDETSIPDKGKGWIIGMCSDSIASVLSFVSEYISLARLSTPP